MTVRGIIRGNTIELLDPVAMPEGQEVKVKLLQRPPGKLGSPERINRMSNQIPAAHPEDAAEMLAGIEGEAKTEM